VYNLNFAVHSTPFTQRERERESGAAVRSNTVGGVESKKNLSSVLKVPRQCPLVLPMEVKHLIRITPWPLVRKRNYTE
jgi:hypothetical protein